MPTRTWAVIRSQRFLKLEGKSFHTSLFFVSLFVLTFARLSLCFAFIVSVCCRLYYINVIIALLLQHERWCDDAYSQCTCYSVTEYLLPVDDGNALRAYERNNAQQKNKSVEYGRSKMRWSRVWAADHNERATAGNCSEHLFVIFFLSHFPFAASFCSIFCV